MDQSIFRKCNGVWESVGVSTQADAIERGGSFYLDLDAKAVTIKPWQDGSTDALHMQPVGLEYDGPMVETQYGWKIPLRNHVYGATFLQLVDLQSARVPDALENYLGNGVALIYSGMPVANIPQGEWIPKRIAFSGMVDDCTFAIQDPADLLPGSTYSDWVPYSIAVYHDAKRNNGGFRRYTTGKIGHLPRPVAIGWRSGEITGWAYGEYREVSHGVFDKVFFRDAQFDADMTRRGIGNPVTVAVSADLGYTTIATNQIHEADTMFLSGPWPATDTSNIESVSFGFSAAWGAGSGHAGVYRSTGGDTPTVLVEDTGYGVPDSESGSFPGFSTWDAAGTTALVNGTKYFPCGVSGASNKVLYDTGQTGQFFHKEAGITISDAFPGSISPAVPASNIAISGYLTLAEAVATPITTNADLTDTTPTRGDSITLTADATSDNTITKMEYFIGADPGEDAGIDLTLTPSSGTSVSGSIVIDTTSLDSGAYTVSVRAFDATAGWGAVDTIGMDVALGIPQNVAAEGGDEQVTLTWDTVVGATSYNANWGLSTPPTGSQNDITSPWVKTGLTNGLTYYFYVQAVDGGGVGGQSEEVSAVAGAPEPSDVNEINMGLRISL